MVDKAWRQVRITHARNRELAEQVKKLLEYSGFTPVIAEEPSATGGLSGISAAVAFDERRIIVLARRGAEVSEALRGVPIVRYSGEALDASATLALLAAINELNSRPPSSSV